MMEQDVKCGAIFSPVDVRDYCLAAAPIRSFPDEFELKLQKVKNQGSIGSCVAHSLAEIVEYHNFHESEKTDIMSTEFIYGNRKNSDWKGAGMILRDALENLRVYGDVEKLLAPENIEVPEAIDKFLSEYDNKAYFKVARHCRISTYYRLHSANEIKQALMDNGPVLCAYHWYSDANVDKDGVLHSSQKKSFDCGGHCMVIYGWNKIGWKVRNSWSESWGNKGNCIIPYDYAPVETWGVVDNIIEAPQLKRPFQSNRFTKFMATILNFFGNIIKKKQK